MKNEALDRNTFTKEERLSGKKRIDQLFISGKSFLIYPFKITYLLISPVDKSPVQIAFGVSKKYDKRAVKRNLIRRRMREAYRKNKRTLCAACMEKNSGVLIFSSYVAKTELDYKIIEEKTLKILEKLATIVHEETV